MNETFSTMAYAAVISVTAAIILRKFGWGIAIPLIVLGALVGAVPFGPQSIPEPEVILVFVLAPLVFGEAMGSSFIDLRRVSRPVLLLAVGLVIACTAAVAFTASSLNLLPIGMALALGAILSPTDAVAISQVAKSAHLPRRLVSILEGEALVNDGSGLTLLAVALTAVSAGSITLVHVTSIFVVSVAGGIIVGLIGGWLLTWGLRKADDMVAMNALILVAPFALYLLAEEFQGSGILSVVVAGLMIAHSLNSEPEHSGRLQSVIVWRHITFALQAVAFFLIGFEFPEVFGKLTVEHRNLVLVLVPIVIVVMIVTRFVFVALMAYFGKNRRAEARGTTLAKRIFILGWAGARGPVSGLAAFSIPLVLASGQDTPYRDVVIAVTFAVVFLTLLLSLTMAPLVRLLKIEPDDDTALMRHVHTQLALSATVALEDIEARAIDEGHPFSPQALDQLRFEVARRAHRHSIETGIETTIDPQESVSMIKAAEEMVRAQQRELLRLRTEEDVPESVIRPLLRALDARSQALKTAD